MHRRLIACITLCVILFPLAAHAELFTWKFAGTVTGMDQGPGGDALAKVIPLGTPIGFEVVFDSAIADSCAVANMGWFPATVTTKVLGSSYSGGGGLEVSNPAGNCAGAPPASQAQSYVLRFAAAVGPPAPFLGGFLSWNGPGGGDTLPSVMPGSVGFQLNYACGLVCADGVRGGALAVPEPGILLMAITATMGMVARRRKGRAPQ